MLEDCQVQKKKNSRNYQRTLTYLYLQKLKCPNCNRVLGGKATTKKNGKPYFYYYCHDCKIEFRENLINEYFNQFIDELVQNVKDMDGYKDFKKQLKRKEQKLAKANEQTEKLDNASKNINRILDNLKPTLMNKNNMVISSDDVQEIKNFTKDVKDTNKTIRSVNDLNVAIKDYEHSAFEIEKENRSLKYQIEEKESIKAQLHKFKEFWHSIMGHFHKRICYDKDNNYKIVSDDLYKNGIFTDDENEIANNIARKVKPKDEINNNKNNRKKNDTRF